MAQTPRTESVSPASNKGAPTELYALDLEPGQAPPKGFMRGRTVVLICALLIVTLFGVDLVGTLVGNRRDARLVDAKAALVSDRVTHVFEPTVDGVVERWTAAIPGDTTTERQIRLATEDLVITRRNMGDFSVGDKKNLTGREVIETGIESITVTRLEVRGGAEMRYASEDDELRGALVDWSKAQQR